MTTENVTPESTLRVNPQEVYNSFVANNLKPDYSTYCDTSTHWATGVVTIECCGLGALFYTQAVEQNEKEGYGLNGTISNLAKEVYGVCYVRGYDTGFNPDRYVNEFDPMDEGADKERFHQGFADGRASWELVKNFRPDEPEEIKPEYSDINSPPVGRSTLVTEVEDMDDDLHCFSADDDKDSDHYDDFHSEQEDMDPEDIEALDEDDGPDEDLSDFNDY